MDKALKRFYFGLIFMMVFVTVSSCDRNYVDLGLPSGTKWKTVNETNPKDEENFYTYDDAVAAFGDKLPTKEQFMELVNCCDCKWTGMGLKCVGANGKFIVLPAAGECYCGGGVDYVGSYGNYWSSTQYGSDDAWRLYFRSGEVGMSSSNRCLGQSVRLVQD
ncbi:MAG: DUF1566 domain-containing protein [Bacteroidales bacterium]|nr:DUF1566 domain-containing protein [Bacteroidales bacterium]